MSPNDGAVRQHLSRHPAVNQRLRPDVTLEGVTLETLSQEVSSA
jgi:hypothetical protein